MSSSLKFDVVIIGAGPAGCSTGYLLAKSGLNVLIIERGSEPGAKQLWGGKAYAQPLREVWPELDREAPIHRWISIERFSLVSGERVVSLEYKLGRKVAFTTYLSELVSWMAKKAEEAGAMIISKTRADEIVMKNGRVIGVRSGSDIVEADVIVDAEGINRILLEKIGLVSKLSPEHIGLGVKEVLKLNSEKINERFGLEDEEGVSWLVIGDVTKNIPGGGFIYTMRDTISLGIVVRVSSAYDAVERGELNKHVSEVLEDFRTHPYFYRLWSDAEVIEYGSRLVIENPVETMPKKLYMPGLIIVGDAAGTLVNTGYTFRGVDTAVYSGKIAAETILEAFGKKDFSEEILRRYEEKMKSSYIYDEILRHKGVSDLMREKFLFKDLPRLLTGGFEKILEADYEEPKIIDGFRKTMRENNISLLRLLSVMIKLVSKL
jgi:electron transfer flavoprotein-quinone oxidoreductase